MARRLLLVVLPLVALAGCSGAADPADEAVGVSFAGLGPSAVYANLLIAGLQSCLLAYFFMHLKGTDNLTWLICGAGIFWLILLFGLLLTDYVTRQIAAY